jgi:hypothetical protein
MPRNSTEKHKFVSSLLHAIIDDAVKFFSTTPVSLFPPGERFEGGGVYALYYQGDCELYKAFSGLTVKGEPWPIYVGKAVPPGWRTARAEAKGKTPLLRRIREHSRNIEQAENLSVEDFKCRYMILEGNESGIIGPVEAHLIRKFGPLWNAVIDGFGNHTPGEGRFNQARSGWDVLHPGRPWAARCVGKAPDYDVLVRKIEVYVRLKTTD